MHKITQELYSFFDSYLRVAVKYFWHFFLLFYLLVFSVQLMEIKNYIAVKLVPELLRQKIIYIDGADDTEFINIDSVDVKELNEAFALTKPYAVDVKLSRYAERDVKHEFHLVVKVSNIFFSVYFLLLLLWENFFSYPQQNTEWEMISTDDCDLTFFSSLALFFSTFHTFYYCYFYY